MSKTDLRARPLFSHTREAIEAHLTIRVIELFGSTPAARLLVLADDGTLGRPICLNRGENRFCLDADHLT